MAAPLAPPRRCGGLALALATAGLARPALAQQVAVIVNGDADHHLRHRAAHQVQPAVHPQDPGAPGGHRGADRREAEGAGRQALQARDHRQRGRQRLCRHGQAHAPDAGAAHQALTSAASTRDAQGAHPRRHRLAADRARQVPVEPADPRQGRARQRSQARKKDDKDRTVGYEYTAAADPVHRAARRRRAGDRSRKREAEALRSRFDNCETGLKFARRAARRRGARPDRQDVRRPAAGAAQDPRRPRSAS